MILDGKLLRLKKIHWCLESLELGSLRAFVKNGLPTPAVLPVCLHAHEARVPERCVGAVPAQAAGNVGYSSDTGCLKIVGRWIPHLQMAFLAARDLWPQLHAPSRAPHLSANSPSWRAKNLRRNPQLQIVGAAKNHDVS